MDTTQGVQHYAKVFQDALAIVKDEQAAAFIVEQIGKDSRMAAMQARFSAGAFPTNGNGSASSMSDVPATGKQKGLLRHLGVDFEESISKAEASRLIDLARG